MPKVENYRSPRPAVWLHTENTTFFRMWKTCFIFTQHLPPGTLALASWLCWLTNLHIDKAHLTVISTLPVFPSYPSSILQASGGGYSHSVHVLLLVHLLQCPKLPSACSLPRMWSSCFEHVPIDLPGPPRERQRASGKVVRCLIFTVTSLDLEPPKDTALGIWFVTGNSLWMWTAHWWTEAPWRRGRKQVFILSALTMHTMWLAAHACTWLCSPILWGKIMLSPLKFCIVRYLVSGMRKLIEVSVASPGAVVESGALEAWIPSPSLVLWQGCFLFLSSRHRATTCQGCCKASRSDAWY